MTMEVRVLDHQNHRFSFSGECPHCRRQTVFMPVAGPHRETLTGPNEDRLCAAMQCQGCYKYILGLAMVVRNANPAPIRYEEHYPLGQPDDSVAEEVPPTISADFGEALRCRWVNAYNATVEMCRRAIEASCLQLGAKGNDSIEAQIDWVHSQGKITTPLKEMAHKIRLGGNRGAHPSQRIITENDADAIIEFTQEYFDHVYVMPAKMAKFDFSKRAPIP